MKWATNGAGCETGNGASYETANGATNADNATGRGGGSVTTMPYMPVDFLVIDDNDAYLDSDDLNSHIRFDDKEVLNYLGFNIELT